VSWIVYVLVSRTASATYVGVSVDARRRLEQHNGKRPGGAKATRAGRPWKIGAVYGPYATRAIAQSVEHAVKRRRGRERLRLPGERPAPLERPRRTA
jgi:predicted GIY-YIG superfamily endonuclease